MTPEEILARAGAGDITEPLRRYVLRQRWFGGRSREPIGARVTDAASLTDGGAALVFVLLTIAYRDGTGEQYNVPLEIHGPASAAHRPPQRFLITEVPTPAGPVTVFDALGGTSWAALMWRLAGQDARISTCAGELEFRSLGTAGDAVHAEEIRAIGGEQSNTSLAWRDAEFMKYVRRVEPGPPIELEILEALGEVGFGHAPRLLGSVVYRIAGGAAPSAVALVQSFLPGAGDGWGMALRSVAELLYAAERGGQRTCSFAGEAEQLGRVTGELHLSLGSPRLRGDMSPAAITAEALRGWSAEMRDQLDELLAAAHPLLEPVRRARARLVEAFGALSSAGDGGLAIRTHGDYHLGQVMRTPAGWMVLDFEGEPARSTAQRRRRYSPLRDVAGMLRSFDYAAATGAATAGEPGKSSAVDAHTDWWSQQCRGAFWGGYQKVVAGSDLLSAAGSSLPVRRAWEFDKAVYELRYELGHRPDWVAVPLRFLLAGN